MANKSLHRIKSIVDYHRFSKLPKPEHPLISVVDAEEITYPTVDDPNKYVIGFYSVTIKKYFDGELKYGQQEYDFDAGTMFFLGPNQVFSIVKEDETPNYTGWVLLVHPDFLMNTPLAQAIKQYEYFGYSVNEALFLSEEEDKIVNEIKQNIERECHSDMDEFSRDIIIAQLEGLLNYAERFYQRQFKTRKPANDKVLNRLEELLDESFSRNNFNEGLPTVQKVADNLAVSPNYLSTMLKQMTGQSTQQHIHNKLIGKAKEQLSTTELSVSEIAYNLGFEHIQSFSRLFKRKTNLSPREFRNSFN